MDMNTKYTKEQLEQVVASATSFRQAAQLLDPEGQKSEKYLQNYISALAKKFGLDTSHFTVIKIQPPKSEGRGPRHTEAEIRDVLSTCGNEEAAVKLGFVLGHIRPLRKRYNIQDPTKALSKRELVESMVGQSTSYTDLAEKTGIARRNVWVLVRKYQLDVSHFPKYERVTTVPHWRKGKVTEGTFVLSDRRIGGQRLRRAMLLDGFEEKCGECGQLPMWNGKFLQLQVDHKNGNGLDSRRENLRFLCANCHTQTETYCMRNKTRYT